MSLNGYPIGQSRVKRSAADLLVSQMAADKIGPHLYRRRIAVVRVVPSVAKPYVPTKMPSKELPGLRFRQSAVALAMQASSLVTGVRRIRREFVTA